MPHKSRRRGKHLSHGKRGKGRQGFSAPAQPLAVARRYEPTPRTDMVAPTAKVLTPRATVAPPINTTAELRRIGILAGVILALLVVFSLVLR
jgi:hypothetical protein